MSNLKRIREEKGLTQVNLAKIAEISPRMVSKYENGERDIFKAESQTVYKIAQALGCTVEDILAGK